MPMFEHSVNTQYENVNTTRRWRASAAGRVAGALWQAARRRGVLPGLIFILLCDATPATAQVYRWVDDQRVVHYSQTPPRQKDHNMEVESVRPPDVGIYSARNKGGTLYCGSRQITVKPEIREPNDLVRLQQYRAEQQLAFRRAVAITGYDNSTAVEEHRCLMQWANAEWEKHAGQLDEYRTELDQLKQRRRHLLTEKQRDCPNSVGMLIGPAANEWAECDRKLSPPIRSADKRIEQLERLLSPPQ